VRIFLLAALCVFAATVGARARCTGRTIDGSNFADARARFLLALAERESSLDPLCVNRAGYLGLFQMGEGAMIQADFYVQDQTPKKNDWIGSFTERAAFLEVSSAQTYLQQAGSQEVAVRYFHDRNWARMTALRLDQYIGQTMNGVILSKSGMTAGAHLVGVGAVQQFIASNGQTIISDGNGTPITEYMTRFGGYY
jgi:hypothetical protein